MFQSDTVCLSVCLQRDLDALTLSGTTINELEIQLMHSRGLYKRTLEECKQRLEGLRRRLNTSIQRSEPFLDVYRRARQVGPPASFRCYCTCVWPGNETCVIPESGNVMYIYKAPFS